MHYKLVLDVDLYPVLGSLNLNNEDSSERSFIY